MSTAIRRIVSHRLSAVLDTPKDFDGSPRLLLDLLTDSAESAELTPVAKTAAAFDPDGASAVVLLAESHIAVHYWPEHGKITVDIHVCDYSGYNFAKARRLAQIVEKEVAIKNSSWRIDTITG